MEERKGRLDLSLFKKAQERMILKSSENIDDFTSSWGKRHKPRLKEYTKEEIERIIASGSSDEQQKLSRNYFYKDGFYKRIIIYYATLLKYVGVLIPNAGIGKTLSTSHIEKKYHNAMDYIENISLSEMFTNCSLKALIDGGYYGIIQSLTKNGITLLDLPGGYARSIYKDLYGNDVLEFDVSYFNGIFNKEKLKEILQVYPKSVQKHYKNYSEGKLTSPWVKITAAEGGICFSLFDDALPMFLNVIPATIQYDEAVETERERELEEIRKIIVQKIPHLTTTGELLFEPDEAEEIHNGTVGMMKGNKNVSVLTTYADVDSIVSKTTVDNNSNNLEKMMYNIYYEAGTSPQIFSPSGNLAIDTSIKNDVALMMVLANKYSHFITYTVNKLFSNGNINFKYNFLPISYYNEDKYIENSFKLAQSGYSYILPALALGLSQRDLSNIKDLENVTLKLEEKLHPLGSAYTQSAKEDTTSSGGAPEKEPEEATPKTQQNKESLDKQGGSK